MKKWMWLLLPAALLAFSACAIPIPGDVYLSFDWAVDPTNWDCTDPNVDTPGVLDELAPGFDYLTLPGSYFFEYTHDNVNWYDIYYILTAHKGVNSPGEDAIFLMYLNVGTYPNFYQIQGLSAPSTGSGTASPAPAAHSVKQSGSTFDKSNYQFKQLGEYSQTQGSYTLTVRTGVWEPKK